jgi:O-antigen/teichoic acid export membrane protein
MSGPPAQSGPRPLFFSTLANFASQASTAVVALICFPVYLHLLGREGFGLIGFSYSLQALLRAFDFGLTTTVVREIARAAATAEGTRELPALAGTFETLFAAIACSVGLALALLSPWLAASWLHSEQWPADAVATCVLAISLQCGVGWLSSFYQSALLGLERQVLLSLIKIAEVNIAALGALALLFVLGPHIELVFLWNLAVGVVALACYGMALRLSVPVAIRPLVFQGKYLRRIRAFAAGVSGITLTGLLLANMDKIFLSTFLPLDQFGDYSLASFAVSTLFNVLVLPIYNVMLPRLSAVAASHDTSALEGLYHLTVQLLAAVTLPVLLLLVLFGQDFLELWTADATVAASVAPLLSLLATGQTANILMVPAYLLQLASGWTALGLRLNIVLLLIYGPLLLVLTEAFGALGAAANVLAQMASYLLLGLPLTHTRLLPGQAGVVLRRDLLPILALCVPAAGLLGALTLVPLPLLARVSAAGVGGLALLVLAALSAARVRAEIRNRYRLLTNPPAPSGR